jgi:hypothetical protein
MANTSQGFACQILAQTKFLLHFGCHAQDDQFIPFEVLQHPQPI